MRRMLSRIIPQRIKNTYHLISAIGAVSWYKKPAKGLRVIGITGTDGKTTTATLLYQILKNSGLKVALITSVAAYIGDKKVNTGFHVTTPSPWALQKLIVKIKEKGIDYLILETTSHGFDQHRLHGIDFEIGVLTNITNEHLDYHKTYNNYLRAKARLFKKVKVAILNKSDKSYRKIRPIVNPRAKTISYSIKSLHGDLKKEIHNKFPEVYNQLNATAASIAAEELGLADSKIVKGINSFKGVPGRMEEVKNNKNLRIIVDFAHTSNSIEKVLRELKKQKKKGSKLIVVFGCASERDDGKRAPMAGVASKLADIAILTAEDPRYEDTEKILDEMMKGVTSKDKKKVKRIPERGEAIFQAINKFAGKGDIVAICGKGHEESMAYNGIEYPWSDFEAVDYALNGKIREIKR